MVFKLNYSVTFFQSLKRCIDGRVKKYRANLAKRTASWKGWTENSRLWQRAGRRDQRSSLELGGSTDLETGEMPPPDPGFRNPLFGQIETAAGNDNL